jgi:aspartate racemase
MKTIGLIGGMSWESSLEYYRLINQMVKARLGGHHSAECLLYSVDFAEIEDMQQRGAWEAAGARLAGVARQLERGGAECIVLCTNTMHKTIQAAVDVPLLHIADATAQAVRSAGLDTVGLLGTIYTMEGDFYSGRLVEGHGLRVILPDSDARQMVNRVIFDELVNGALRQESRAAYVDVIRDLQAQGAQGVILGCTEIGLLVKQDDSPVPVFDTTALHAAAAVDFALS